MIRSRLTAPSTIVASLGPMLLLALSLGGCSEAASGDDQRPTTAPTTTSSTSAPPTSDDLAAATTRYAGILKAIVTDDGLVRYDVLASPTHRQTLREIVKAIAKADLPTDRDERLALWCNAYNAYVLDRVLTASEKPGFENVVKVDGFFDKQTILVAGETLTLNDLENTRIRPLGDARIHAALVCAAISCPPLRAEPFTADRLDDQLADQARRWVNDSDKNRVVGDRLGLSSIFDWYGKDFTTAPYNSVQGFIRHFATPGSSLASLIDRQPDVAITWLTYDWTLNRASTSGTP